MKPDLGKIPPAARTRFIELLKEAAADETQRVYAVLDGAKIEKISQRLANAGSANGAGLGHVALYRGEDRSKIAAGPWLVTPYVYDLSLEDQYEFLPDGSAQLKERFSRRASNPVRQIDVLFEILEDPRSAAFWIGDPSLSLVVLFDHLRGLNMVRAELPDAPENTSQMVHFRHADANALAQTIPALTPRQTVRLLGPAQMLVALPHPAWSETAVVAEKPRNGPDPQAGPLVFDARTMAAIEDRRKQGFVRKIAASLRKTAPKSTAPYAEPDLLALVSRSMEDARKYGVKGEAAHYRWAHLTLASNGQFSQTPEVKAFMDPEKAGPPADERVRMLMKRTISYGRAALLKMG